MDVTVSNEECLTNLLLHRVGHPWINCI